MWVYVYSLAVSNSLEKKNTLCLLSRGRGGLFSAPFASAMMEAATCTTATHGSPYRLCVNGHGHGPFSVGGLGTLSSQTSDTLSSRTSVSSSFYSSSGFSDTDDWEEDDEEGDSSGSGGGTNGEEYRRRLSEESRQRLMRKLDSVRFNPKHHVRRIVPVAYGSSIDGKQPLDLGEVHCS